MDRWGEPKRIKKGDKIGLEYLAILGNDVLEYIWRSFLEKGLESGQVHAFL